MMFVILQPTNPFMNKKTYTRFNFFILRKLLLSLASFSLLKKKIGKIKKNKFSPINYVFWRKIPRY